VQLKKDFSMTLFIKLITTTFTVFSAAYHFLQGSFSLALSYILGVFKFLHDFSTLLLIGSATLLLAFSNNLQNSHFNEEDYVKNSRVLAEYSVMLWHEEQSNKFFCNENHAQCVTLIKAAIEVCYLEPFTEFGALALSNAKEIFIKGTPGIVTDYVIKYLSDDKKIPDCYKLWFALETIYPETYGMPMNVGNTLKSIAKYK